MHKWHRLVAILIAAAFLIPASGSAETFLVISDTHFTKEARDDDAMQEAVIQAARESWNRIKGFSAGIHSGYTTSSPLPSSG